MKKNPTKALPPMSSRLRSRFRVVLISELVVRQHADVRLGVQPCLHHLQQGFLVIQIIKLAVQHRRLPLVVHRHGEVGQGDFLFPKGIDTQDTAAVRIPHDHALPFLRDDSPQYGDVVLLETASDGDKEEGADGSQKQGDHSHDNGHKFPSQTLDHWSASWSV